MNARISTWITMAALSSVAACALSSGSNGEQREQGVPNQPAEQQAPATGQDQAPLTDGCGVTCGCWGQSCSQSALCCEGTTCVTVPAMGLATFCCHRIGHDGACE